MNRARTLSIISVALSLGFVCYLDVLMIGVNSSPAGARTRAETGLPTAAKAHAQFVATSPTQGANIHAVVEGRKPSVKIVDGSNADSVKLRQLVLCPQLTSGLDVEDSVLTQFHRVADVQEAAEAASTYLDYLAAAKDRQAKGLALCSGPEGEISGSIPETSLRAAERGDALAAACFVALPMTDIEDPGASPLWLQPYAADAA